MRKYVLASVIFSGVVYYYKDKFIHYLYKSNNKNSISKTNQKNIYTVDYYYNNQLYKILIRIKKGPRKIIKVEDENHTDITNIITPYLGPNENTHDVLICPKQLGYNLLYFYTRNNNILKFENMDNIIIHE